MANIKAGKQHKDVYKRQVMLCLIANLLLLPFGLTGIKIFAKFVEIPKGRLFPIIVILAVTGAYVTNNLTIHIGWMLLFGFFGYLLKKFKYPASPLVLGIVLGNMLETNMRNGIIAFRGVGGCINSIFTRPITFLLFLIILWSMISRTSLWKKAMAAIKNKIKK